jgi:hypothetical protein
MTGCNLDARALGGSGGTDLQTRRLRENQLGRQAATLIAAADEEDFGAGVHWRLKFPLMGAKYVPIR